MFTLIEQNPLTQFLTTQIHGELSRDIDTFDDEIETEKICCPVPHGNSDYHL